MMASFTGYTHRMNFRSAFWPGFLLGALTAFAALFRKPPPAPPATADRLLDFVSESVLTCDASGQITEANAAARTLFGADLVGYQSLCYPTGQPVPSGQLPLTRPTLTPARFLLTDTGGQTRTLEATTRLLPGGAAAVFQDVTAHTNAELEDARAQADMDTLLALSRRLGLAQTAEDAAGAAAEAALALGAETARCFLYDRERRQLIQAAARPDTRPKRPQTQHAARPVTAAFDATDPRHWAVYVAKEAFDDANTLALPLTTGGSMLGHLAGRQQADRAEAGAAREAALSEIAALLAQAAPLDTLCDAVASHLRHLLAAEVCTVMVSGRLRGQNYRDGLLRPERHTPKDTALNHEAADAARESGEMVQRTNLSSPDFASGVWRAFAGASGKHRVLAVPLASKDKRGALTVWASGDGAFSAAQVRFAETLAALLSARLAITTANRTTPQTLPGPADAG